MKRSLNSASLDTSSDGAESAPIQPSSSELVSETQGPRAAPMPCSAHAQPFPDDAMPLADNNSGRWRSSSGRSRRRHRRRTDPWEAYVRDNWIPTLERTFGPDWRRHCPGEVAALIWWAIASRAGVGTATLAPPEGQHAGGPLMQLAAELGRTAGDIAQPRRQPAAATSSGHVAPVASNRNTSVQGVAVPLQALLFPLMGEPFRASGTKSLGSGTGSRPLQAAAALPPSHQLHATQVPQATCGAAGPLWVAVKTDPVVVHDGGLGTASGDIVNGNASPPLHALAAVTAAPAMPVPSHRLLCAGVLGAATAPQPQKPVGGGAKDDDTDALRWRNGDGDGTSADCGRATGNGRTEHPGSLGGVRMRVELASGVPEGGLSGGLYVSGSGIWDAAEEADLLHMLQQGLEARLAVKQQQQHQSGCADSGAASTLSVPVAVEASGPEGGTGSAGGNSAGSSGNASGRTLPVLDLSRPLPGGGDSAGGSSKFQASSDGGRSPDMQTVGSLTVSAAGRLPVQQPATGSALGPVGDTGSHAPGKDAVGQSVQGGGVTAQATLRLAGSGGGSGSQVDGSNNSCGGGDSPSDGRAFVLDLDPSAFPGPLGCDGPRDTSLNAIAEATSGAVGAAGRLSGPPAIGDIHGLATDLLPQGAAWPARVLLPPDARLPLSAAAAAFRTYNLQLPDGSVMPVQLVPLHILLSGATASTGSTKIGGTEAAVSPDAGMATILTSEDMSGYLTAAAAAVGGCRPLSDLLNRSDPQGRLPLHAAAATGRVEMVERLLALGCDAGRQLEQDFLHGAGNRDGDGNGVNPRLDSAYDCTSSASSSCNFCADEYDIPILNELPAAEAALSTGGHGAALRRRRMINAGENVNADGRAHRRHEDFMGGGAEAASATAAAVSGDVDDAVSGGSFSDSDDVIFGADDSSPSPMSVAQAARLGLHIALDTCGDRLTPDQLHFLAGKFAEQQLWRSNTASGLSAVMAEYSSRGTPTSGATATGAANVAALSTPDDSVWHPSASAFTSAAAAAGVRSHTTGGSGARTASGAGLRQSGCDAAGDDSGGGNGSARVRVAMCWLDSGPPSPIPNPNSGVAPPGGAAAVAAPSHVSAAGASGTFLRGRLWHENQHWKHEVRVPNVTSVGDVHAQTLTTLGSSVLPLPPVCDLDPAAQSTVAQSTHRRQEERGKRHGDAPDRPQRDASESSGDHEDGDTDDSGGNAAGIEGDVGCHGPSISQNIPSSRQGGDSGSAADAESFSTEAVLTHAAMTAPGATATGLIPRRRPRRLAAVAPRTCVQQHQSPMYDGQRTRWSTVAANGRNKRQADGDAADVSLADGEVGGEQDIGRDGSGGNDVEEGRGSESSQREETTCDTSASASESGEVAAEAIVFPGDISNWVSGTSTGRKPGQRTTAAASPPTALSKPSIGYIYHDGGVDADDDSDGEGDYDSNPDVDGDETDLQGLGVALMDGMGVLSLPLPLGLGSRRLRRGRVPLPFAARPNYVGASPLHLAASHGHMSVCEVLLRARGCDLVARTAQGRTALHLAARNGHEAVVALLLRSAASASAAAASTSSPVTGAATGPPCGIPSAAGVPGGLGAFVDLMDAEGHTALHHAAAMGHWRVVEELWPRGASIDAADSSNRTPLHYAAMAGHVETAGRLIIAGAGVHKLDCNGYMPAHHAAMKGHAEVLEKLLLAGYEVDMLGGPAASQPDALSASNGPMTAAVAINRSSPALLDATKSRTPLQPSASPPQQLGGLDALPPDVPARGLQRPLPPQPAAPTVACSSSAVGGGIGGHTALHLAASGGHCAAIAVLFQHGASVERRDWRGCTALHRAAEGGHRGAFELLLMHGADPRLSDASGAYIFHSACRGGNLAVVQRLLELGLDHEADAGACSKSAGSHLDSVLDASICPPRLRTSGSEANSPLNVCPNTASPAATSSNGSASCSRVTGRGSGNGSLIVDPAAPASDGRLPLHWAAAAGHGPVVVRLLQLDANAGGDPLHQDHGGATPWHLAAAAGQEASIRVFLAPPPGVKAVPVDARDGAGCTALHRASAVGAGGVVGLLLAAGADPAATDEGNRTPLHFAAEAGLVTVMRLLLKHLTPADVDRRDAAGWSALHHAAHQGNAAMLQLLLQHGACPHSATSHGWTPAHLAARGHHANLLVDLLVAGADPRVRDADGCTPVHFTALRGDEQLFERLQAAAAEACAKAYGAIASAKPADGNCTTAMPMPPSLALPDARGYTLLHYAVEGGNLNIISRLLAAGLSETTKETELVSDAPRPTAVTVAEKGNDDGAVGVASVVPWGLDVVLPSRVFTVRCPLLHSRPPRQEPEAAHEDSAGVPYTTAACSTLAASHSEDNGNGGAVVPALDRGLLSDATTQRHAPLNALHLAAKLCLLDAVQMLLAAGYSAASRTSATGQTPLHFAAMGPAPAPIEGRSASGTAETATPEVGNIAVIPAGDARAKQPATQQDVQLAHPQRYGGVGCGPGASTTSAATYHGDQLRVVDVVMAAGANPLVTDVWGCMALSYAAGSGNHGLVARLLAAGCDPVRADRRGLTPLHWGAAGGSADVVAAILAAGGYGVATGDRVASLDCLGRTPLHWAAEAGALGCVTVLTAAMLAAASGGAAVVASNSALGAASATGAAVVAAADLLLVPDAGGCSAVQLAAAGGHVDVVAKILEACAGRSVAAADTTAAAVVGLSALHLAAQAGLEQVVAQLLCLDPGCGVDVNARDADSFTPLHAAATRGSAAITSRLLRSGADPNIASSEGLLPLHAAAAGGHLDVVELLLDAGSLVSYKSSGGATPLHQAASNGHAVVCEVLLEAGCPVMGRLASGASALYCAASAGWDDVIDVLLRAGAEVDAATTSGCTALHGAATNGHAKVITQLLAEGADSDLQSSNGHTPLHNAAGGGHVAAVESLLAGGADVDAQNSNGNAPLHTAASKGYLDIVCQLVSAGADLHIRNSKGWCAVHSAASNGFFEVVLKLVQAGASWRRQGEADVVRLLTRKTTYKTSYVEGRLRLAERERHRNQQQGGRQAVVAVAAGQLMIAGSPLTAAAAVTSSGGDGSGGGAGAAAGVAGATAAGRQKGVLQQAATFEDLAAVADANMAALLEEEEAAVAAAIAAAERKAKQKKKKTNKTTCKLSTAAAATAESDADSSSKQETPSTAAAGTLEASTTTDAKAATAAASLRATENKGSVKQTDSCGENTPTTSILMPPSACLGAATAPMHKAPASSSPAVSTAGSSCISGVGVSTGGGNPAGRASSGPAVSSVSTAPLWKDATPTSGAGSQRPATAAKAPSGAGTSAPSLVGSNSSSSRGGSGLTAGGSASLGGLPDTSSLPSGPGSVHPSADSRAAAANGPIVAGTVPGSKPKGPRAMASGGVLGVPRIVTVKSMFADGSEGSLCAMDGQGIGTGKAAGARAVATPANDPKNKPAGFSATVETASQKISTAGKRTTAANSTGSSSSTPTVMTTAGRNSASMPPAGVDTAMGGKQLLPPQAVVLGGPHSLRQQRGASREGTASALGAAAVFASPSASSQPSPSHIVVAGTQAIAPAVAALGAATEANTPSGGTKIARSSSNGGKAAMVQTPVAQLPTAVMAAPTPTRPFARNGCAVAGASFSAAYAPTAPPSSSTASATGKVTLAQVVAGPGAPAVATVAIGAGRPMGSSGGSSSSPHQPMPSATSLSSAVAVNTAASPSSEVGGGGSVSSARLRPTAAVQVANPTVDVTNKSSRAPTASGKSIAVAQPAASAAIRASPKPYVDPPSPHQQQQTQSASPFGGMPPSMAGSAGGPQAPAQAMMQPSSSQQHLQPPPIPGPSAPVTEQLAMHASQASRAFQQPRHQRPVQHLHPHQQPHSSGAGGGYHGFARPPPTAPGFSPIADSLRHLEGSTSCIHPSASPGRAGYPHISPPPTQLPQRGYPTAAAPTSLSASTSQSVGLSAGQGVGLGAVGGVASYMHSLPNGPGMYSMLPAGGLEGTTGAASAPPMAVGAIRAHVAPGQSLRAASGSGSCNGSGSAGQTPSSATAASAAAVRHMLPSRPAASQPVSPIRMYSNGHDQSGVSGTQGYGLRHGLPQLSMGLLHHHAVDWSFGTAGAPAGRGTEGLHPPLGGFFRAPPPSVSSLMPPPPSASQAPAYGSSPAGHLLQPGPTHGYTVSTMSLPTAPVPGSTTPFPTAQLPPHSMHMGLGMRSASGHVLPSGGLVPLTSGSATWDAVRAMNARDNGHSIGMSSSAPAHHRGPIMAPHPGSGPQGDGVPDGTSVIATVSDIAWPRYPSAWSNGADNANSTTTTYATFKAATASTAGAATSRPALVMSGDVGGFFRSGSATGLNSLASTDGATLSGSSPTCSSSAAYLQPSVGLAMAASAMSTATGLLAGSGSIWSIQPSEVAAGGLGSGGLLPSAFSPLGSLGGRRLNARDSSPPLDPTFTPAVMATSTSTCGVTDQPSSSSLPSSHDPLKVASRSSSFGDSDVATGSGVGTAVTVVAPPAAPGGGQATPTAPVNRTTANTLASSPTSTPSSFTFHCPLTCKVMRDPVVAADGFTYEREAILTWLRNHSVSPLTGEKLCSLDVVPNWTMRAAIQLLARQ